MEDKRIYTLQHPLMEIIASIAIAITIWFGGKEVIAGNATPGTFFAFIAAFIMIYDPIKKVSKINASIQHGLAASIRVFTLLDVMPDIVSKPDAKEMAPFTREIAMKDLHFKYENEPVLTNINLTVPAGQILAIVGPSGAGKSTLINLIPRFFDIEEGSISIDGQDIRDINLQSLREQIAIVTQHTILFNETIRNNIAYGDSNKSDEEIRSAADAAHALSFIDKLPKGLDTVIGESGMMLSGGERQRLSIARAILKNRSQERRVGKECRL